jgi:hypothetical protein
MGEQVPDQHESEQGPDTKPPTSAVKSARRIWNPWQRIAFRFGFVLGVLYIYPLPFGLIPYTDSIAEALQKPWHWLTMWFAESVLGVGTPATQSNGSGDRLYDWVFFLVLLIASALGAVLWSVLDRKRKAYPRLATGMWIALRYLLAWTLLSYATVKIFSSQFPLPSPSRLDQRLGDISPMRLMWMFQGYSQPYTFFGGCAEALAGVLLLWRRTATVGALVAMAVMTNVVMLNLCYDVCVKLYSMQLLVIAIVIAMPQLRRVARALLGHAVAEVPPRVRSSRLRERARLVAKLVTISLIAYPLYERARRILDNDPAPHELFGIWRVEAWTVDGEQAPARWRKLCFNQSSTVVVTDREQRVPLTSSVLPAAQAVAVKPMDKPDPKANLDIPHGPTLWHYAHPERERLVIDRLEGGKRLRITLTREPEPLLMTRGFHWINESPYNR